MKRKHQNAFFIFGLAVLLLMLSQLDYAQVKASLSRAGYWFAAVVALWGALYALNTSAWLVIIRSQDNDAGGAKAKEKVGFWWLYKVTVSGFAINYATPGGLMGGEPYRIMALAPKIGTERASASVILYVMTHIFSHFWFWLLSTLLYIATQTVSVPIAVMLAAIGAVCAAAIWAFAKGYRHGITVGLGRLMARFPIVSRWARPLVERNADRLKAIDEQIAELHNKSRGAFLAAVGLELACRVASALEIFFILLVIAPQARYIDCILILAFTSLVANLLFFIPLQLGGREGGFLLSAKGLALTANAGIFVALIVRLRELTWTAIGLALIKLSPVGTNNHQQ